MRSPSSVSSRSAHTSKPESSPLVSESLSGRRTKTVFCTTIVAPSSSARLSHSAASKRQVIRGESKRGLKDGKGRDGSRDKTKLTKCDCGRRLSGGRPTGRREGRRFMCDFAVRHSASFCVPQPWKSWKIEAIEAGFWLFLHSLLPCACAPQHAILCCFCN